MYCTRHIKFLKTQQSLEQIAKITVSCKSHLRAHDSEQCFYYSAEAINTVLQSNKA